jgi:hypothetical protein
MSVHEDWRHKFPSLAASEDFVHQHPFVFIGYSIALIVVYLIVVAPLYRMIAGPAVSRFEGNLLYTGPGGSLDNHMGSCRSDRDGGPYGGCGAAEAFQEHPLRQQARAVRSQFASDAGALRHLQERSRFLSERAPDAVFALEQADADAMAAEISSITGDNEAAVTVGLHQAAGDAPAAGSPSQAAQPASRFSARSQGTEARLGAIGYGFA